MMSGGGCCGVIGDATTASVRYATISRPGASSLNGTSSTLVDHLVFTLGGCSASTLGGRAVDRAC